MRYYETLYIVNPTLEETQVEGIRTEVDKFIQSTDSTVVNSIVWGKRRLAYTINKQQFGVYILVQFQTENPRIDEIKEWFELNESVLAHITVCIDNIPPFEEMKNSLLDSSELFEKERTSEYTERR